MRRLPVYLLVDCSESMAGDAIVAVKDGIAALLAQLRADPQALETVYLSVITFANSAKQIAPLSELCQFKMPDLTMGSGTSLGAALTLFEGCLKKEVVKSSPEVKGDYKPICYILTDGDPTDNWEVIADRIKATVSGKKAFVVALACGPDASVSKLKRITEDVLVAKNDNSESLKKIFRWVSASVAVASQSVERSGKEGVSLDKLPADCLEKSNSSKEAPRSGPDRFVFLHAKCVKTGKFYIMRFKKQEDSSLFGGDKSAVYEGVASHKVEKFDFLPQSGNSLKVSTTQLKTPPHCPYCESKIWAMCSCGGVHCSQAIGGGQSITLTCPWCETTQSYVNAEFDVGRGQG